MSCVRSSLDFKFYPCLIAIGITICLEVVICVALRHSGTGIAPLDLIVFTALCRRLLVQVPYFYCWFLNEDSSLALIFDEGRHLIRVTVDRQEATNNENVLRAIVRLWLWRLHRTDSLDHWLIAAK